MLTHQFKDTAEITINTDRLILRPHEVSDFAAVRAMWSDPGVIRHIFDRAQSEAESWTRLLRYRGHWDLLGFGYWAVIDRQNGTFIGEVGFADYRREIDPPFIDQPEAGWVMTTHAHGYGFGYEAVDAALRWADSTLSAETTVAMITPENTASIRLAERLGYALARTSQFNGQDRLIYERPRKQG